MRYMSIKKLEMYKKVFCTKSATLNLFFFD